MLRSFKLLFLVGCLIISPFCRSIYGDSDHPEYEDSVSINWGDPAQTEGDNNQVVDDTDWCLSASKEGGFWLTKKPFSWYGTKYQPEDEFYHSLVIDLDPDELKNTCLTCEVKYYAFQDAALEIDLFDANEELISQNIAGNLIRVTNQTDSTSFTVSMDKYPGCTRIRITQVSGTILVYETIIAIEKNSGSEKLNSNDSSTGKNIRGIKRISTISKGLIEKTVPLLKKYYNAKLKEPSSELLDYDGDGLCNRDEKLLGTDPFKWDTDGDGISDGDEVNGGTNPLEMDENLITRALWLNTGTNTVGALVCELNFNRSAVRLKNVGQARRLRSKGFVEWNQKSDGTARCVYYRGDTMEKQPDDSNNLLMLMFEKKDNLGAPLNVSASIFNVIQASDGASLMHPLECGITDIPVQLPQ